MMRQNNAPKQNRNRKLYVTLTMVFLVIALAPILFLPMVSGDAKLAKIIGIFSVAMTIPVLILSLKVLQSYYDKAELRHKPLLIPKAFGYGLSINPYHPAGKAIWFGIIVVVVILLIKMIVTPA
ncbi:hypothetical protein [Agrilactobacillus composti]|nr:hypothetical protein [Agrilactobacillus composti]